jgi:7-cyano-7-deazaguanine synthase
MASSAVVLLSGGLDSATAGALARREGWTLHALTVRYGQRNHHEIAAAGRVAEALGVVRHLELAVDLSQFGGSALTGPGPVPKDRPLETVTDGAPATAGAIPQTYVPARNTVLLSLALGWAEVLGAERIVIGTNAVDYSGYPDCRPEFLAAFEYLASLGTRAGVEGRPIRVWAPLEQLSKAGIIRVGLELGFDYGLTHSCYDPAPDGRPCRRCDSCRLRARGFAEAGHPDPLLSPGT